MTARLVPPTSYQGGKQRIAAKIVDIIDPKPGRKFADLCCGSGSISIELVNRGFDPRDIVMVDRGPWDLFWRSIGDGSFDVDIFGHYCESIPKELSEISGWMIRHARDLSDKDSLYMFPILQAASFGGKAIWLKPGDGPLSYRHHGFRSYWLPTEDSNRRSPVNPMGPMPATLIQRVRTIADQMKGVEGLCADVESYDPPPGAIIYVDPPYGGTTDYGYSLDLRSLCDRLVDCYVSEGGSLSDDSTMIVSSGDRKKGGISGNRATANEEWLSRVKSA